MIHLLREAGCEMLMGGIPALWRIYHNWGRADFEKLSHAGRDSVHRDSLLEEAKDEELQEVLLNICSGVIPSN